MHICVEEKQLGDYQILTKEFVYYLGKHPKFHMQYVFRELFYGILVSKINQLFPNLYDNNGTNITFETYFIAYSSVPSIDFKMLTYIDLTMAANIFFTNFHTKLLLFFSCIPFNFLIFFIIKNSNKNF